MKVAAPTVSENSRRRRIRSIEFTFLFDMGAAFPTWETWRQPNTVFAPLLDGFVATRNQARGSSFTWQVHQLVAGFDPSKEV
jgi:hypothetical protein